MPVEFTEARGQAIANACDAVTQRLESVASELSSRRTLWQERLNGVTSDIGTFSNRAENSGLDVVQLRESLAELTDLAGRQSVMWQDMLGALDSAGGVDCQSDELDPETIHDAIEEARTAKVELGQSWEDLAELIQNTLRNDINDIRQQMAGTNTGQGSR